MNSSANRPRSLPFRREPRDGRSGYHKSCDWNRIRIVSCAGRGRAESRRPSWGVLPGPSAKRSKLDRESRRSFGRGWRGVGGRSNPTYREQRVLVGPVDQASVAAVARTLRRAQPASGAIWQPDAGSGLHQIFALERCLIPTGDVRPVHNIPPRLDVIGAHVMVFEIVGVLPNVQSEDPDTPLHQWVVLVWRAFDDQTTVRRDRE